MRSAGRTRRMKRHGVVYFPLAAAVGMGFIAGCTSGGSPASSSTSPPTHVATSAAPSTPAPASSSAPPVSSPSAAVTSAPATSSSPAVVVGGGGGGGGGGGDGAPACATRGLQASLGASQGALGSVYQVIDFTNISGGPCTLFGYPGVALAAGTPVTQVGEAASRSDAAAATLVTLGAGETANALLRVTQAVNYPASRCHPVATAYLQIYPPGQTTPLYLAYKSMGCTVATVPLLTIGVIQAGRGSSGG